MKSLHSDLSSVTREVGKVVETTEKMIAPARESLFKRFPVIATLLVTFGITATVYGLEQLIEQVPWLHERPFLIFIVGILTLTGTGKLYQKLG